MAAILHRGLRPFQCSRPPSLSLLVAGVVRHRRAAFNPVLPSGNEFVANERARCLWRPFSLTRTKLTKSTAENRWLNTAANAKLDDYDDDYDIRARIGWEKLAAARKGWTTTKRNLQLVAQKENIMTVPNMLCVTRIVLSPLLAVLVLQHNYSSALAIFAFAGATDLLDGMIARHFPSQRSMLGTFLDPMADKLLVSTLFLSLTVIELIPLSLTALIVSRDVCLLTAGFYIRYVSLPSPKTFSRYFDVTHPTASLSPTLLSKINTSVQLSLVASTLAASAFDVTSHPALQALWYVTAATTIASGLSYVFSRDTFKLLRQSRPSLNRRRLAARRFLVSRGNTAQPGL